MLEKRTQIGKRHILFWIIKYIIFNVMYIPLVLIFQEILFSRKLPEMMLLIVVAAGQLGIWIYDRAYEYVQGHIWNKMRGRLLR